MLADWLHPSEIKPVRVLRVELRGPLTLGHVLLLDELQSPIVTGDSYDIGQLMVAALVCSQPVAESRRDLRAWWMPLFMKWNGYRCATLDFGEEAARFAGWMGEQCGGPTVDTGDQKKEPRSITSPWYVYKLALAVGELGLSIPDAEAMPVKRLNQLIGAYAESQSEVRFVTPELHAALETIEKAEARMIEELKQKEAA